MSPEIGKIETFFKAPVQKMDGGKTLYLESRKETMTLEIYVDPDSLLVSVMLRMTVPREFVGCVSVVQLGSVNYDANSITFCGDTGHVVDQVWVIRRIDGYQICTGHEPQG